MDNPRRPAGLSTQSRNTQIRLIRQLFTGSLLVVIVSALLIIGPWRYLSEERPAPPTWYINVTYYLFPVLPSAIYGLFSLLLIPKIKAGGEPWRRYFKLAFGLGILAAWSALLAYLPYNDDCGTVCGQTKPSIPAACLIILLTIPPLLVYPRYLARRFNALSGQKTGTA